MGCSGSKSSGDQTIKISMAQISAPLDESPASLLESAEGFDAFVRTEEADEKELQQSNGLVLKMVSGMGEYSLNAGASTTRSPGGEIWQRLAGFRSMYQELLEEQDEKAGSRRSRGSLAMGALRSETAATALFEDLLRPSFGKLPKLKLFKILLAAIENLRQKTAVAHLPAPPFERAPQTSRRMSFMGAVERMEDRLIIVGDTHGQLQDVLHIFLTYGKPSASNRYLFNGDVADRGENAVEIFALILAFELACPGSVTLTRGNHEARDINERPRNIGGGFYHEVMEKYDEDTYELFQLLFIHLPLAAQVGKAMLVVHGGLSRIEHATVETIEALDYRTDIPAYPVSDDDLLMFDSVWSDPREEPGVSTTSSDADGGRGDGACMWGPDVTERFLEASGLDLIVRSHQVPAGRRGFQLHHDNKVITIFSASNYCGVCMNRGAVLIVPASGTVAVNEHMATSLEELREAHWEDTKKTRGTLNKEAAQAVMGWRKRAHERAVRDLKSDLLKRTSMEDDEKASAQESLVAQLIPTARARVCQHHLRLIAALEARHQKLVRMEMAAEGGRLLPLAEWRECVAEALNLQAADWDAMPALQAALAAPIALPSAGLPPDSAGGAPALDPSLYPAVDFVLFTRRFHVEISATAGADAADTTSRQEATRDSGINRQLLSIVYAQGQALRKALLLTSAKKGVEKEAGRGSSHDNRRGSTSLLLSEGVAPNQFLAAVMALLEHASAESALSAAIGEDEVRRLIDVAPKDAAGNVLYDNLLSSLTVIDTLEPPASEVAADGAAAPTNAADDATSPAPDLAAAPTEVVASEPPPPPTPPPESPKAADEVVAEAEAGAAGEANTATEAAPPAKAEAEVASTAAKVEAGPTAAVSENGVKLTNVANANGAAGRAGGTDDDYRLFV